MDIPTESNLPAVWVPKPWVELQRGEGVWVDDISDAAYFQLPLASRSRLEVLRESPPLYWARFLAEPEDRIPDEDTKALRVGRYTHKAVLEVAQWEGGYTREPAWEFDGRTRDGKAERAAWKAENAGLVVVKADEYDLAMAMYRAIARGDTPTSERARNLLIGADATERVLVWRDKVTGVLCRARLDAILYGVCISDLKTADDVGPDAFGWAAGRRGYARQAAMYIDGVAAVTGEVLRFADIAVHKSPTHEVAIYEFDEYALEAGRRQYRTLLAELDRRMTDGDWLADVERGPQLLSLPGQFLDGL